MTSVEQMVASQGSTPDQNQDEVHLTELLPVEQSRFTETCQDNQEGTDALKVLRSYPHCSNDEFNAQFNVCGDDEEGAGNGFSVKRRPERWKHISEQMDKEELVGKTRNCTRIKKAKEEERKKQEDEIKRTEKSSAKRRRKLKEKVARRAVKPAVVKTLDKEVADTIDAIIQKTYLLERENNNVLNINNKFMYRVVSPESAEPSANSEDQNGDKAKLYKKYGCVMCDAKFKGTGGLRNHYKVVHGAGPSFKCNECGKEFPLKERLKLHVRTHTGFRPYKCNECDKTFARGGQLAQHRRTHSQVKPYRCTLCSGMFTCSANLSVHMKRHNGQKDHKCEICGRGFVRRDALKKHLECLHQDVKSFLCVICNKTFKGHLPQHMRTHAQDRPHGCATCGQRFAQKSQLTVHQRTHSGQRPFRCVVCWQAFAHSTALKLHTRRHTGERPFKCVECNAGFTQLPHWKKHMRCIHGRNEPYGCKYCKSFFRIKSDLEVHEKSCLEASSMESSAESNALKNSKFSGMSIEKMRLLLAVLLKRISKPERLEELGFGKRLIDEILEDSLIAAGKDPIKSDDPTEEHETLRSNLEMFLEWTVPQEHWKNFMKKKKTPEQILETLTAT